MECNHLLKKGQCSVKKGTSNSGVLRRYLVRKSTGIRAMDVVQRTLIKACKTFAVSSHVWRERPLRLRAAMGKTEVQNTSKSSVDVSEKRQKG